MNIVRVFVEAEAGSNIRHVYDESTFERRASPSLAATHPFAYGFVVGTSSDDGAAVDCYVLTSSALAPGRLVECEPVGLLEQFENGVPDHKLLAIPRDEPIMLDPAVRQVLEQFIQAVFRDYPRVTVEVGRLLGADAATAHIAAHRPG